MRWLEVALPFFAFWSFVLDPTARHMRVVECRNRSAARRFLIPFEALWAAVVGLSPVWLATGWLLAGR